MLNTINTTENKLNKIPVSDTRIGVATSVVFNKTIKPSAMKTTPIANFFSETLVGMIVLF